MAPAPFLCPLPGAPLYLNRTTITESSYMKNFLMALCACVMTSAAAAGRFEITDHDYTSVEVEYTGTVDFGDTLEWARIVSYADGRVIFLVINSGGGYAHAGIDLYWALEAYPNLVTYAGADYGAYSAAAIMWAAGDVRKIEPGGGVWFHAAYCTWDPTPPTEIGCNTESFQVDLIEALEDAGFRGLAFNIWLNLIQDTFGTDGWIGATIEGWFIWDSTEDYTLPFDPTEIGGVA